MTSSRTILQVSGVSKRFGSTVALAGVDLRVNTGELHALIGHNGAGKSTLVRILGGVVRPDAGHIALHGQPIDLKRPADADAQGLGIVHQHPELCDNLSVAENIALGREPRGQLQDLDRRTMRQVAEEALGRVGADIAPNTIVSELGPAERQLVAISRAVVAARDMLVLDEPTAALSVREANRLFQVLESLRLTGFGILFITHRLEEVLTRCTQVTVLSGGRVVADRATDGLTQGDLVEAMLGRRLTHSDMAATDTAVQPASAWTIRGRSNAWAGSTLELRVIPGRITGLFGMPGSGRERLMRALIGRDDSWKVEMRDPSGMPLGRSTSNREIGFVPNDRAKYGVFANLHVLDNVALGMLRSESRWLRPRQRESDVALRFFKILSIRARSLHQPISSLSGGNQQKVLVARALASQPHLLLLDEPTKGVDVGSRDDIYRVLRELAQDGNATLVASQDEEELVEYCDRLYILQIGTGRLLGPVEPPFDRHQIVATAATADMDSLAC